MAIGIIAIAFVALIGLLPVGLNTYRAAIDESNQTWIMQSMNSMVQTTDFAHVKELDFKDSNEIYYFGESSLGAVRIDDFKYRFIEQPGGWIGGKVHVDAPTLINLRLDPFERLTWPQNGTLDGAQEYFSWFQYEFWRFVFVQQEVAKLAETAIAYPPMQKGSSFNLEAVKAQIEQAVKQHAGE